MRSPDVRLPQSGRPNVIDTTDQADTLISIGIANYTEMSPALNARMYEAWQSARVTDTDTLASQKEQFGRAMADLRANADEATSKKLDLVGPILEWATFCEPRNQLPEGLTYENKYGWLKIKPVSVEVDWAISDVQTLLGKTVINDLWTRRGRRGRSRLDALEPLVDELVCNLPETRTLASMLAPGISPCRTEQRPLSSFWRGICAGREEYDVRQKYGVRSDLRQHPGAAREYLQRTGRIDNETMPAQATARNLPSTDPSSKLRAFLIAGFDRARSSMGAYGPPPIVNVLNKNGRLYFVHVSEKSGEQYEAMMPSAMQDAGVTVGNALGMNRTPKEAGIRRACNAAGEQLARCLFDVGAKPGAEELLRTWREEVASQLLMDSTRDLYGDQKTERIFDRACLLQLGNMPHGPMRSKSTHYDSQSAWEAAPSGFLHIAERLEQKKKVVAEVSYVQPPKPADTPRMLRRDRDLPHIPPLYPGNLSAVALYLQTRKDDIFAIDGYRLLGKDYRDRLAYAYDDGHDPCLKPAPSVTGGTLKAVALSRTCQSLELAEIAATLEGYSDIPLAELNDLIKAAGTYYHPATPEEAEYLTNMALAGKFAALKDKNGALRLQCNLAQLPMYWLLGPNGYDVSLLSGYALPHSDGVVSAADSHTQLGVVLDGLPYNFDATPALPDRAADEGRVSMPTRVGSFVRRALQGRAARERQQEQAAQREVMDRQLAELEARGTTLDHVDRPDMPDNQEIIDHGNIVLPKLLRQLEEQLSQAYGVPDARAMYSLLGKTIPRYQRLAHPVWQGLSTVRTAIKQKTISSQDVLTKITYIKHCAQPPPNLGGRNRFDPVPAQQLYIICDTLQIVADQLAKQEKVREALGAAVTLECDSIPERIG